MSSKGLKVETPVLEANIELGIDANIDRKSSVKRSIYNIICTMVGAGILSLPTALAKVGWVYGFLFLTVITLCATYCGNIMGRVLARGSCKGPILTYEDMGEVAAGKAGRYAVYICSYGTLYLVSILMLILASNMWEAIFPHSLTTSEWIAVTAAIIFPLLFVRTLNHVAFISFFGMAAVLVVVAYVFIYSFVEYAKPDHKTYGHVNMADVSTENLSSFFTTVVFSFGGAPLFAEIYRCLRQPEKYSRVMYGAFSLMFSLYTLIMISGYFVYGDYLLAKEVKGNIVLALPSGWGQTMVSVLILIHVIAAYVVIANPLFRCIEAAMNIDRRGPAWAFVFMGSFRTLMLGSHFFIACLLPFFPYVMNFIGATTSNFATFILPCWFYVACFGKQMIASNLSLTQKIMGYLELLLIFAIVVISILAGVLGAKDAIEGMEDVDFSIF
eukprot:Nk52_evm9s268 gene=Nk52_evmTU9s268